MTTPSTLRPEQRLALAYARHAGTEAPVDKIRGKMAETFAQLESLVEVIPAATARNRPSPAGWSIHEIVDHLVESHRPAVEELEMLVRGESPTSGPVPAGLQSENPEGVPWSQMVARLRQVHADLLAAMDRGTAETPLEAKAAIAMVVKCQDEDGSMRPVHWQEAFDWKAYSILLRAHTLEHVQQIRRLLDSST